jgi:hypothetical protein
MHMFRKNEGFLNENGFPVPCEQAVIDGRAFPALIARLLPRQDKEKKDRSKTASKPELRLV